MPGTYLQRTVSKDRVSFHYTAGSKFDLPLPGRYNSSRTNTTNSTSIITVSRQRTPLNTRRLLLSTGSRSTSRTEKTHTPTLTLRITDRKTTHAHAHSPFPLTLSTLRRKTKKKHRHTEKNNKLKNPHGHWMCRMSMGTWVKRKQKTHSYISREKKKKKLRVPSMIQHHSCTSSHSSCDVILLHIKTHSRTSQARQPNRTQRIKRPTRDLLLFVRMYTVHNRYIDWFPPLGFYKPKTKKTAQL